MTAPAPDDRIPALIEEAKARGLDEETFGLLDDYRRALRQPLAWYRKAGRAFAEEGLETDVLKAEVERWLARERMELEQRLAALLGSMERPTRGVKDQ